MLRRLLLIQPRFDYTSHVCSRPCVSLAWYPNLTQKMKNKIQPMQNKWIQYGLQLEKLTHILKKEFETLTGSLQMTDSINPQIKLLSNILQINALNNLKTRNSYLKLIWPFRKTNTGKNALSFIGPSLRNKNLKVLKKTKHNL